MMNTQDFEKQYPGLLKRAAQIEKQTAAQEPPPTSYEAFIRTAAATCIAKDTDYNSRFMRGMAELDARTIWA